MITDDNYTPGSAVEPTLLLRYLIEKAEELAHRNYAGFPLPFRGLGATVLDPFPELQKEFLRIVSASEESVNERAEKCKDIFIDALGRPQDRNPKDQSDESHEQHSFDRTISNRFAWAARREGEEMIERKSFEFIQVWECMTFIALQEDAEKLRDFQEKCLQFPDPQQKIEQMIPILWEVLRAKMRKN